LKAFKGKRRPWAFNQ